MVNCIIDALNNISCKTAKLQETLIQRKKLKYILENSLESFNDSDKDNLNKLSSYIVNPLISIKIKNYFN